MEQELETLRGSLVSIAVETYRFQGVFERAISKLDLQEQSKYMSQFAWFSKRVHRSLEAAGLQLVDLTGELYDPGMAATPLNLEDLDPGDTLYVARMMEPIILRGTDVVREGTIILGRIE